MAIQPVCCTILDHIVEQAIGSRSLSVSDIRPTKWSEMDVGDSDGGKLGDCGIIGRARNDLTRSGRSRDRGDMFGQALRGKSGTCESRKTRQSGSRSLAQVDLDGAGWNCKVDS